MKKMILKSALLAVASVGLTVGSAMATLVDFTSIDYSAVEGTTTYTKDYADFSITLESTGGSMTFNDSDSNPWTADYTILEGTGDGIGIGDDEIGPGETLTATFDPSVHLNTIYLLDLFYENNSSEEAIWTIDLTYDGQIYAVNGSVDGIFPFGAGFVSVDYGTNNAVVASINFTAIENGSDYALAGFNVTSTAPVPEPATMLLFGTGLAGLAGFSRKKSKKA